MAAISATIRVNSSLYIRRQVVEVVALVAVRRWVLNESCANTIPEISRPNMLCYGFSTLRITPINWLLVLLIRWLKLDNYRNSISQRSWELRAASRSNHHDKVWA